MTGGARGWSVHLITFGLFLAALAVWSVAMPRFAAPDENRHVIKAWAVAHGQAGRVDPATGTRSYTVPAYLDDAPPCYAFKIQVTPECLGPADGPDHETISGAAGYPPVYYVMVGAPALLASGETMLVLMRLLSAAWVALFLALATGNLARTPRPAPYLPALLIVLGPVVFFFGSTVNPSGLSIATGLAAWTAGIALVRQPPDRRVSRAVDLVGLPLCLLILLRRDSVIWTALIILTLVALSRSDVRGVIIRAKRVWAWGAAIVACSVLQLGISGAEAASATLTGTRVGVRDAIGELPDYLQQMLGGRLGWLDTALPPKVYLLFEAALVVLLLGALVLGRVRLMLVMVGAAIVAVTVPVAIRVATAYGLQGRYFLPFAVGVPLIAAAALVERRWPNRWPVVIGPITAVVFLAAQVVSFVWTMRRFTAGVGGPWWFKEAPVWQPPVPTTVLVVLDAVVFGLTFAWLVWRLQFGRRSAVDGELPVDHGVGPVEAPAVPSAVG